VFVAVELLTAPRIAAVSPAAGTFQNHDSLRITVDLPGADRLSDLSISLDDKNVTPIVKIDGERLFFDSGRLADGEHVVSLRAKTSNLLRPNVEKTWRFVVDTVPPKVALAKPRGGGAVTLLPVTLTGRTEPNAVVTVHVEIDKSRRESALAIAAKEGIGGVSPSPSPSPSTSATGAASGSGSPSPSSSKLAGDEGFVVASPEPTVADEADTSPSPSPSSGSPSMPASSPSASPSPSPTVIASPTTKATTKADGAGAFSVPLTLPDGPTRVTIEATDGAGNASTLKAAFTVDVNPPELVVGGLPKLVKESQPRITVIATDQGGKPRVRIRLDGDLIYDGPLSGQYALPVKTIMEGTHSFLVTATDPGHNVTRDDRAFLVNSTEKLGKAVLTSGAKGRDVKDLQRLLANQGYFKGRRSGVYDKKTVKAVQRFQSHLGMAPDGVTGPMVLSALRGRIIIDQSECKLYFYLNGKLKKIYPVAVGQPAWPTPNGTFYVSWMVKNPTWIPPDSPWAQGAVPIPPGPGNPVGTRWIGTSAPGVGMHGTPDDASVGSHASHGCIRMHMWDVEELYEWVTVGMPVIIRP